MRRDKADKKQKALTFFCSRFSRNGVPVKSQLEQHKSGGHLMTMGTLKKGWCLLWAQDMEEGKVRDRSRKV